MWSVIPLFVIPKYKSRTKGESDNLQPVTKEEIALMFELGVLKIDHGRIPGLITGSKAKHGKGKPRYVQPDIYKEFLNKKRSMNKQ